MHETAAPPELQQRLEAYVGLIEQLVSCPAGEEPAVLQAHQDLLDLPFLQVLGAVAEQAYQQEETRPIGEFLGQVAIQLQGAFGQALQERLAAYQQLVVALATCPEGETAQVLAAHPDLQDVGLVLCLGQEAGKLQVLGQGAVATRLLRLGQELGVKLGLSSSPEPEAPTRSLLERLQDWVGKKPQKQKKEAVAAQPPPKPEVPYLVLRLLQLSQARQEQGIYQLLRQSALPEGLGEDLARWAQGVVPHLPPEQRQGVVADIGRLGEYLLRAPTGNIPVQMGVAIRVLEVALSYWDKEADLRGWAARHHQLAIAYSDCPRGDKQRNYQQALVHYQQALQVYNRTEYPLDWAMVQNNMGLLYRQWPGEAERSVHIELAIACFQSALESYTPQEHPQLWAITQVNLGQSYAERPQGDRLENLHRAMSCYRQALPVLEAQQMVGAKQQAQQLLLLAEQALFQEQQKTVVQVAGETVQIGDQVLAAPQLVQRLHRYELWMELRVQMLIDTLVREIPWSEAEQREGLAAWQQQVGQQGAAWLAQRGLTEAELPGWVTRPARLRRLQEQMFGHKVETYFLERKGSLDRVRYYLIRHEDEGVLKELSFRIGNREGDVEALASEYGQGEEAQIGGLIGPVELGQLPPALIALLGPAQVGQVIGPVHLGQQFGLLVVKQKIGAQLTAQMRQRLLEELFMEWVREQLGHGMG
jgi:parvulin-like peptidyl-prolyl isomerase